MFRNADKHYSEGYCEYSRAEKVQSYQYHAGGFMFTACNVGKWKKLKQSENFNDRLHQWTMEKRKSKRVKKLFKS